EQPRVRPWLSARDNVRLAESERLAHDAGYTSRADRVLAEVGLRESADAWPSQLSGGMQRRVALARAFVVEPWLLLMDEPFVSLDLPTGNRLRRSLRLLCARVRPLVMFVTHDVRAALALADRVLFLGGSPARVVLDYRVESNGEHDLNSTRVNALRNHLLTRYPRLLSGILEAGPNDRLCDQDKA